MKRILLPTDFTIVSENAINFLHDIFIDQSVEIILIYIRSEGSCSDEEITQKFENFKNRLTDHTAFKCEYHIQEGDLTEEIQKAINNYKPNLVIMGTRGAHGSLLPKSLIKLTNCPVMTIPEVYAKMEVENIAYANDFQDIKDATVLEPLLDLARILNAKIHIIHINRGDESFKDNAESAIEYYLNYVDHEYVCITSDNIEEAIHDYLTENEIDILTVLLRDHGNNTLESNGKLVGQLITNAKVPVLNLI